MKNVFRNKINSQSITVLIVVVLLGVFLGFSAIAQSATRHKNGELINSNGTIYLIQNDQRWGFRTIEEFISHGYKFDMVLSSNSSDLELPYGGEMRVRAGTMAQDINDGSTLYFVYNTEARPIPNQALIFLLGFEGRKYLSVDISDYTVGEPIDFGFAFDTLQPGTLVNDNGTIFIVTSNGRAGFPSEAVFRSYGYNFESVFPINTATLNLPVLPDLGYRDGTLVNDKGTIFLISGNKKYGFKFWEEFVGRGYKLSAVINGDTSGLLESVLE
ncbi:MAG: hypothetical protein COU35_00010 [Candidatus Magasanikbacteria bacterium CG10_big_fil_rev_8_21_14_0_10_47_10]|uniref:Uncharacterized protein n=1 Tax=Candidatus Magasanikbacteria bacterium CG10_big_fil_rev_8_21_14_0_10_47_10 TaxID=1974652 RepID=A0A2H0TRX2_9BACT|nr:MAG: hypothetical protein COU35_00010 [Candidatus Magasanikbacteria bacterium CG10_big_fil_rev_8_21_14_0_10_47_10]